VALTVLAAVLFGALIALDPRFGGRRAALVFIIAAALSGWIAGRIWMAFAPEDWLFDSVWVELSAACCVFALRFGGEDGGPWSATARSDEPAPDADALYEAYALRLFQAVAFGAASAVNAWAFLLAFLALMVAGRAIEAWLVRLLRVEGQRARASEAALAANRPDWAQNETDRAGAPSWLETAPRSFIAALNAASEAAAPDQASAPGSSSPAPRQIRVVHNAAKPLDARSAASTRPIARANGTAGPHKIPTEARDPARGRR